MAEEARLTRRDVIKKAAYLTPAVVTLLVAPSFASSGSGRPDLSSDQRSSFWGQQQWDGHDSFESGAHSYQERHKKERNKHKLDKPKGHD
jgi:hypothetical protein